MQAGRLRNRCTLMTSSRERNTSGGFDVTWIEAGRLWADITTPTGQTRAVAEQLAAVVSAEIRVRPKAEIVEGCRLVRGNVTYLIEAVLPDNKHSMLRLLCSSVPNP
ncbi:head-tail adaptor protein [Pseudomonas sp. SG-MS2]|uniref:phage head closure protein n=1 Tax=Pseudomonas sp. SG-MS2 TaxID=1914534 RepID=UPI00137A2794|nr:phage head closure protein [Pseudomonas sp. SG-MS2]KAF1310959.1 head-tail adaptor protein [Pseudomonas sp. SG-MS2]